MTMTNDYDLWLWLMTMTNEDDWWQWLYIIFCFDANVIHTIFAYYARAFIILLWGLCGCWINEKLAPTQSDIIFRLL